MLSIIKDTLKRKKDRAPDTNNFLCHVVENKMGALNEEILNMIREHFSKEQYISFLRRSEKLLKWICQQFDNFLCHLFENKMGALKDKILNMLREHFSKEQNKNYAF